MKPRRWKLLSSLPPPLFTGGALTPHLYQTFPGTSSVISDTPLFPVLILAQQLQVWGSELLSPHGAAHAVPGRSWPALRALGHLQGQRAFAHRQQLFCYHSTGKDIEAQEVTSSRPSQAGQSKGLNPGLSGSTALFPLPAVSLSLSLCHGTPLSFWLPCQGDRRCRCCMGTWSTGVNCCIRTGSAPRLGEVAAAIPAGCVIEQAPGPQQAVAVARSFLCLYECPST